MIDPKTDWTHPPYHLHFERATNYLHYLHQIWKLWNGSWSKDERWDFMEHFEIASDIIKDLSEDISDECLAALRDEKEQKSQNEIKKQLYFV